MTQSLFAYLGTLGLASYNVDEDHRVKVVRVRTSRGLTPEQRKRCEEMAYPLRVEFRIG